MFASEFQDTALMAAWMGARLDADHVSRRAQLTWIKAPLRRTCKMGGSQNP
jgi:hypothetical protein